MIALRLGALSALVTIVAACESEPSSPAKDISAALTSSVPAGGYTVPEGDPLALVGGVTIKHGGYGSALAVDPKDPTLFYSLTDRGPNVTIDCGGTDVLAFPVPSFTPETGKFRLSGGELTRVGIIQLKQANGTRLTGLPQPNAEANRTEVPGNLDCSLLDQDPNGIDSEGLAIAKDGSFWVSDEYGPDVIHFSATGTTIQRLTPKNGLPLALARRRSNRGMEGLTILSDGKTLAGIMQSPLDNSTAGGSSAGRASRLVRIVLMDTRSGTTRQYGYILDAASNLASESLRSRLRCS